MTKQLVFFLESLIYFRRIVTLIAFYECLVTCYSLSCTLVYIFGTKFVPARQ